jgi:predicted DCC family thiol-disulfide oxidoreductase YuxK
MRADAGIVVFDGVCNLCSAVVRFILQNDREGRLSFVPLQSQLGRELLQHHGIDPMEAQTFLLLRGSKAYIRSDAALEIASDLGRWRWLRVFRAVPRGVRDRLYAGIARNRYKWFGKRDACFVPTPEQRTRFLDVPDVRADESHRFGA